MRLEWSRRRDLNRAECSHYFQYAAVPGERLADGPNRWALDPLSSGARKASSACSRGSLDFP
jgi:hypothetical protein